jgi:hypothetical protein
MGLKGRTLDPAAAVKTGESVIPPFNVLQGADLKKEDSPPFSHPLLFLPG